MNKDYFIALSELSLRTDVSKRDLNKMVRRLVRIYDPLRIYFFGSYAWGDPHLNSDLDFVAIVPTEEEAAIERWDESGKAFEWFNDKYVDFLLYSKQKFETLISSPATMEHKIYKNGILMYTKPDLEFDETQPMIRIEREWFKEARSHMNGAHKLYDENDMESMKLSLFHLQQSIEMSLRAFRAFHLLEIKKSHKLSYFMGHCKRLDSDFDKNDFRTLELTRIARYYWYRYHREIPIPNMETIRSDFERAEAILKLVEEKITSLPAPNEPPANWSEITVKKKRRRKKKPPETEA